MGASAVPSLGGPLSRAWLDVARAAFFEELCRGRSVLCVGVGDGRAMEVLLDRGAARVQGVDLDARDAQAAQARLEGRADVKVGAPSVVSGRFDVVMVAAGEALVQRQGMVSSVLDRLAPGGWLVAAAASADRPGAEGGLGYYELLDRLAPHFPSVTMMGQAPLAGATVAPFGEEAAEPVLDAGLAGSAEAQVYVAVAGPRRLEAGYGLVVLPPEAVGASSGASAKDLAARDEKIAKLEAEVKGVGPALLRAREESEARRKSDARVVELEKSLQAAERRAREVESAQVTREARLRDADAAGERRARELETERERSKALESSAARREARIEELTVESRERQIRIDQLTREVGARGEQLLRLEAGARAQTDKLRAELEEVRRLAEVTPGGELDARLRERERALDEMREAAVAHAEEMRKTQALLDERDAYLAELEGEVRGIVALRAQLAEAGQRTDAAEAAERQTRKRVAELEGTVLRLSGGQALPLGAPSHQAASSSSSSLLPPTGDAAQRIAALEAQCAKLQEKEAEARREAWAHMKARSDAEAQAAEVREDTVRKLKDARKIANVELMRAMEEATKKAVALKEELTRTEAERKELLASLRTAREEISRGAASGGDDLRGELARVEEALHGESARMATIEEGLRRAVAAMGAAEFGYTRIGE